MQAAKCRRPDTGTDHVLCCDAAGGGGGARRLWGARAVSLALLREAAVVDNAILRQPSGCGRAERWCSVVRWAAGQDGRRTGIDGRVASSGAASLLSRYARATAGLAADGGGGRLGGYTPPAVVGLTAASETRYWERACEIAGAGPVQIGRCGNMSSCVLLLDFFAHGLGPPARCFALAAPFPAEAKA